MLRTGTTGIIALAITFCAGTLWAERAREPVIGGPCEGCAAVFQGLPETIPWRVRIGPADEPGAPMRIEGTVFDGAGKPVAGVIVYAYHTDDRGVYPGDERFRGEAAYRHGRLRAWAMTSESGRYTFDTIRPAGYPGTTIAAHVHMHVIEPACCTYYIDDINFLDDPRLTTRDRERSRARAGSGLVQPLKDDAGVWVVTRDIFLGQNIPDYPAAAGR